MKYVSTLVTSLFLTQVPQEKAHAIPKKMDQMQNSLGSTSRETC